MLLAIVFLNVWGVLQLVALGSLARTIRVRTVLAGIAAGLFFCAPLAAAVEYAWGGALAGLTGRPIDAVIAVTGYTVDPPVEEIIRIVPLAFLLGVPVLRRQLGVTDCVLIGAAAGAGFGLAEDLYRFGTAPQHATAIAGGWVARFQSPIVTSAGGTAFIPSIGTAISGWLPDLGGVRLFGLSAYMLSNVLLIWSSLGGLAVGLWLRLDGPRRWYVAAALLGYASATHAAHNADVTFGRQLLVTAPFRALSDLEPLMPIAALAVAWWIDRRRHEPVLPEHLLAAEQGAAPRAPGTLKAAASRMPESIVWVDRFVRLRRAFNTERQTSHGDTEELRAALAHLRQDIDDLLLQPGSWASSVAAWKHRATARLRSPQVLIRIALLSPAILWFVVGGWPETAGLQRALSAGPGWMLVVVVSLAALAMLGWTVLKTPRTWRRLAQERVGDVPASFILRTTTSVGVLGFGGYAALQAFNAWSAAGIAGAAHASDAAGSLAPEQGLPMANGGSAPPTREPYDWEGWRQGQRDGRAGNTPSYPRGASPGYQKAYDDGYRRSQGLDDPSVKPPGPAIRKPAPGEEIETREISIPDADGHGSHVKKFTGSKSQLDMIQAHYGEQMAQAQWNNLGEVLTGGNSLRQPKGGPPPERSPSYVGGPPPPRPVSPPGVAPVHDVIGPTIPAPDPTAPTIRAPDPTAPTQPAPSPTGPTWPVREPFPGDPARPQIPKAPPVPSIPEYSSPDPNMPAPPIAEPRPVPPDKPSSHRPDDP